MESRFSPHATLYFPKNFYWGTSTSAHQVEGDNKNNDWWDWEHKRGKIELGDKSGRADGSFKFYRRDIEAIKKINNNAYRFSIEWSRIEPEPGQWDYGAVEHYRQVLRDLKKNGIEPFVTLYHFTNPKWFAALGGWQNRRAIHYFTRYVRFIAEEMGDLIDFWLTMNEPVIYATQSFYVGVWPPGKKSVFATIRVLRHMIKAHNLSYKIIHETDVRRHRHEKKTRVSFSHNVISIQVYRKHSIIDQFFAGLADWIWNDLILKVTRKRLDFLALNYYFHYRIARVHLGTWNFFVRVRKEHREMSDVGWEIYAPGIFDVLVDLKEYGLPIYITENGVATDNESKRARFLISHLKEVYHAIEAGADVRSYFYWSLLDNFEWEEGWRPHFGLFAVDRKSFKRTKKRTADIYAEIAEKNAMPHHLLKYLGHSVEF